jgi:hypothetical protein
MGSIARFPCACAFQVFIFYEEQDDEATPQGWQRNMTAFNFSKVRESEISKATDFQCQMQYRYVNLKVFRNAFITK